MHTFYILCRGRTHKNAVVQYLNKLAEEALNNSERLLYELISMITKRNGVSYHILFNHDVKYYVNK